MLSESLRRSKSALASARKAGSSQTSSEVPMTPCRPACQDCDGKRPSRCSPNLPDCTPARAVAGRIGPSSMRLRRGRTRPNGIAFLRRVRPSAAAVAEQRCRLALRMGPESGLRFEYSRISTRRVFFLELLEFTAIALAAVLPGGVDTCATRTQHGREPQVA